MDDTVSQYRDRFASPSVGPQGASVIQIESSKLAPLIILLSIISGVSIAFAVFNMQQSHQSERETRMLEYYVMELDGKLMNKGLITPDESWSVEKQKRGAK